MKKLISIILTSLISFSVFAGELKAYMLQNNGYLFEDKGDYMEYLDTTLPEGTEILVLTVTDENGKEVPEEKTSKRTVEKKYQTCKCYHIKYNKKEMWCLTDRISFKTDVAVVINQCAVYRTADLGNIKESQNLKVGQVVTLGNRYINNGIEFTKIDYYSSSDYTVNSAYVKSENISTNKDDFKAIKIINSIKSTNDQSLKDENFKNIQKLNISPSILQYSQDIVTPKKDDKKTEEKVETETPAKVVEPQQAEKETDSLREISFENIEFSGKVICITDTYNLRDFPSTKNSKVINSFAPVNGETTEYTVQVSMVSSNQDTIDGITDNWYYVTNVEKPSVSGWIFGAYITKE